MTRGNVVLFVVFGLITIFLFFAVFLGVPTITYLFFIKPVKVVGSAMNPNYLSGQYYLTYRSAYVNDNPKRGDVIIFKNPEDLSRESIKRIIGLPADQVRLQNCKLYINGEVLQELYLPEGSCTNPSAFLKEGETVMVTPNNYFVLGDNRVGSSDSREWGFVPRENIIAKVGICYYRCSK